MNATHAPLRVLVVDDAAQVAQRIARELAELDGVRIAGIAADGEEALRLFDVLHPDVVITDLEMPRKGGLEVVRSLRRAGARALLIVLTVHDSPALRERCLEAGADFFLGKLDGLEQIAQILRDTLSASR